MRMFAIALAALAGLLAAWTLWVQTHPPGAGWFETRLRRYGLADARRLEEKAYGDVWGEKPGSIQTAVAEFQDALVSDPASPYRWCDLGEAFLEAGREREAGYCLRRAVERGPLAPAVLLRASNGYFMLNEPKAAMRCAARVLAAVPDYDSIIFETYRRAKISTADVLEEGLPAERRAVQSFLLTLLGRGSLDDARFTWDWIRRSGFADDKIANQYSSALLRAGEPAAASQAWTAYFGARDPEYRRANLLFNGGFEQKPSGDAFDWRWGTEAKAGIDRDAAISHRGKWSLRIRFTGSENVDFSQVRERAAVRPGVYLFSAQVRTDHITTDQGIGFRLYDPDQENRLSTTVGNATGTADWVPVTQKIMVRPSTRLIEIAISRNPSLRFDCNIAGTAWIDDVSLVPLQ